LAVENVVIDAGGAVPAAPADFHELAPNQEPTTMAASNKIPEVDSFIFMVYLSFFLPASIEQMRKGFQLPRS
jgi:hypothetical protein